MATILPNATYNDDCLSASCSSKCIQPATCHNATYDCLSASCSGCIRPTCHNATYDCLSASCYGCIQPTCHNSAYECLPASCDDCRPNAPMEQLDE